MPGSQERGLPMFSPEDLQLLDRNYFFVIVADEFDLTIMSRNTGHFWYLHNQEYPEKGTIILFHKHKAGDKYHLHGRGNCLEQVVKSIKSYDRFQLNGRKPVRR